MNADAPEKPVERRSFEFSPAYRPAFLHCFCLQSLFFVLTGLFLDMGRTNRLCCIAIVGQWIGNFIIMGRRPLAPTKGDLLFIQYGIVPLTFAAPFLADGVWAVIGHSSLSGLERWFKGPVRFNG